MRKRVQVLRHRYQRSVRKFLNLEAAWEHLQSLDPSERIVCTDPNMSQEEVNRKMTKRLDEISKLMGDQVSDSDSAKEDDKFVEIGPPGVGGGESEQRVHWADDAPQDGFPPTVGTEPTPWPHQTGDPSFPQSLPEEKAAPGESPQQKMEKGEAVRESQGSEERQLQMYRLIASLMHTQRQEGDGELPQQKAP